MKYRLLNDYGGFAKGMVIEVKGQELLAAMNAGHGEPYIETPPPEQRKDEVKQNGNNSIEGLDRKRAGGRTEHTRAARPVINKQGHGTKKRGR